MGVKKKTLIKDIAERAGVSTGTVSVVLNGRGDSSRIAKDTQQRVLNLAKEMDYQPNISARRLRNGRGETGSNGMVLVFWSDHLIDAEMGYFFSGIQQASKENNFSIEISMQIYNFGKLHLYANQMNPSLYSGIIVNGASDEDAAFLENNEFSVPIILIARNSQKVHSVYSNYYEIGKNAALLFASRGHKRVGIVTLKHKIFASSFRQLGFVDGCQTHGLELRPEWIRESATRDHSDGYAAAEKIIKRKERPTAIFITTPGLVLGCMQACQNAGVRVPDDIEVLTYGNNSIFAHYTPTISTVETSITKLGETALSLFMLVIKNNIEMPVSRLLHGEYTFRQSCGGFPEGFQENGTV